MHCDAESAAGAATAGRGGCNAPHCRLLWRVWQRALATRPAMLPLMHAPPTHTVPQSINLPLTGDDAAIKKYAAEVEALKKKIGMPDVEEVRRRDLQCWVAAGNDCSAAACRLGVN